MNEIKIKRALIAVYDKTGITEFARALVDEFGIEIISTGGTAKHLKAAGVPVTMVEEVTGFPEMLDGRVKTLHPKIHAAILADRDNPDHMRQLEQHGIKPIDMVVVNLYPFEKTVADPNCTFEQAIEMIDIGGPCMLRAAAKNHGSVLVISEPGQYEMARSWLQSCSGGSNYEVRFMFAESAFLTTAQYDLAVNGFLAGYAKYAIQRAIMDVSQEWGQKLLSGKSAETVCGDPAEHSRRMEAMRSVAFPRPIPQARATIALWWEADTRYGENPAQSASIWRLAGQTGFGLSSSDLEAQESEAALPGAEHVSGGALSFNNYIDGDAALSLVKEMDRARRAKSVVAFIKHTNVCGCAVGDDPIDTYRRAYLGDPIAAAGGVLCMNFPVTREIANTVMTSFGTWGKAAGAAFFKLDVWIAPSFDEDAIQLIVTPNEKRKWGKECRLLAVGDMDAPPDPNELDYKKITGGMLVQTRDLIGLNEDQWKVVTKRAPSESEISDLRFAWLVCKHTKSNAITICRDRALLGNGAGQMSRVKSCDVAIQLARENGHGDQLKGAVAAGDAFFPVPDGPQKLIDAGITAIIHPGGSNRDADTVAACDAAGVAMIVTGTRHFKH